MGKNPAQYGLDSVVKEKPVAYDTVKIDYPIDLRLVAECVDATASDLLDLNPSLLRMTTPKFSENGVTGKDQEFELRLPAGTASKFQTTVASIPVSYTHLDVYKRQVLPTESYTTSTPLPPVSRFVSASKSACV